MPPPTRRRLLANGVLALLASGCTSVGVREKVRKPVAPDDVDLVSAKGETLVAASEIASYDWQQHTIRLVHGLAPKVHQRLICADEGRVIGTSQVEGRQAILVESGKFFLRVGGEPVLKGTIYDGHSSTLELVGGPIGTFGIGYCRSNPGDDLRIDFIPPYDFRSAPFPRDIPRLRDALAATGKLIDSPSPP